ncbi:MAG: U32 family peptidase [Eubacteriales bacterium]|nr:U32 family peptidase [Eubacteriales bacterium]
MNYPKIILPELLAPAGSLEHLKAAILAGADAVYFGGSRFGARAYAENFTKEKVMEGLDYAHFHDRRAYMTVNTLLKEKELQESLYEYLLPFYEAGLDGVIVQDLGAASFIRHHFPKMEVHGSTQMMITGVEGAQIAKKMGMTRVVPARELSMEEVDRIKKETGLEVEIFIHGALCYCYSGQCLFSSMYGGRSGNRGRCAQPCRLPYHLLDADGKMISEKEKHLLSPKDLYSLNTLPSMIEHEVDSLKIEGRMKNVDYVAGVTAIYRKYLDSYVAGKTWKVDPADKDKLEELYSRSGFTDGYWIQHNGKNMMSIDTPRHLGLKVGNVENIQKNRIQVSLTHPLSPKDILVIPGGKEDEIVLTVPASLESVYSKGKKGFKITLNVPKTKWLKPGLPVYRRHSEEIEKAIENDILKKKMEYPVNGKIIVHSNEPIRLTLQSRNDEIMVTGETPMPAQNRPIKEEDILRQMKKTGNVPFCLKDFSIDLEDGLFLQASALKELRQKSYELLEEKHKKAFRRLKNDDLGEKKLKEFSVENFFEKEKESSEIHRKKHIAAVYDSSMLDLCLDSEFFHGISLSMDFFKSYELLEMKKQIHAKGKEACLSLPRVFRQESTESVSKILNDTMVDGEKWDVIYINNINEMNIPMEGWAKIPKVYGASLYQWNTESRLEIQRLQRELSCDAIWEIPYEISYREAVDAATKSMECLVYGRFPVMLSAQCLKKTTGRCNGKEEILTLVDRNQRKLAVSTHCHPEWADPNLVKQKMTGLACYNMIWTDEPRNLIGQEYEGLSQQTIRYRFDFFGEKTKHITDIIHRFENWEKAFFKEITDAPSQMQHWNCGIE